MDPQLEKAMSVTAPQREKAAEVVAQYWVKIDDAVMKPAGEVCLVCVCVCFFLCVSYEIACYLHGPVVSPMGFIVVMIALCIRWVLRLCKIGSNNSCSSIYLTYTNLPSHASIFGNDLI